MSDSKLFFEEANLLYASVLERRLDFGSGFAEDEAEDEDYDDSEEALAVRLSNLALLFSNCRDTELAKLCLKWIDRNKEHLRLPAFAEDAGMIASSINKYVQVKNQAFLAEILDWYNFFFFLIIRLTPFFFINLILIILATIFLNLNILIQNYHSKIKIKRNHNPFF